MKTQTENKTILNQSLTFSSNTSISSILSLNESIKQNPLNITTGKIIEENITSFADTIIFNLSQIVHNNLNDTSPKVIK